MSTRPGHTLAKAASHPAVIIAGFGLLTAAAQAVVHRLVPMPRCLLLQTAGIPCPTCGTTRSLAAWTRLDLASAFLFNPLCFLACAGLLLWAAVRLLELHTGREGIGKRLPQWNTTTGWVLGCTAVVLNWIYLGITLPR